MPVDRSMGKIERNLVSAGARNIMKSYNGDGICESISFTIDVNGKRLAFQLPANVEAVYQLLLAEHVRPTARSFQLCREQSERTAWKLISDWVEIQISMIKLEQAELLQIFLPYMHDGKESFYSKCIASDFKLIQS